MKRMGFVFAVLLLSTMIGTVAAGEQSGLSAELRQVVDNNVTAYNQRDAAATMASVHSNSPDYGAMEGALPAHFAALETRTEVVDFRLIGHDEEFAVARVKLKTVGLSDEPFTANVMDTIAIFYPEQGTWKYWSSKTLGVEIVQ